MREHVVSRAAGGGGWSVRRLALLAGVLAAMALAGVMAAQSAEAGTVRYCDQQMAGGADCSGPQHSLTGNEAFNYYGNPYRVCAGAYGYGSYICGSLGYAEHCYSGANLLTPLIYNGESFTQHLYGYEYYGVDPCP